MIDIINSMQWRYAVKKFDAESTLPGEKIEVLKEAFNLTATSYGLQPIKMVVIANKELQKALVPHSYGQEQVAQASHLLIFCIEKSIDEAYIGRYFDQVVRVRGTSREVLDPFQNSLIASFSKKNGDEVAKWATNQAYLAMGNLLTVCAVEKIDSCPMEGFDGEAYDRLLGLGEKGLASVLVMPIGRRSDDDMFSGLKKVRKEVGDMVIDLG